MAIKETETLIKEAPQGAVFLTNDLDRAVRIASICLRGDLQLTKPEFVINPLSDIRSVGFPVVVDEGVSLDDYSPDAEEEIAALNASVHTLPPAEPLSPPTDA